MKKIAGHLTFVFIFSFILVSTSFSQPADGTPEQKGLAIAQEMDRRDSGFEDSEEIFVMKLIDRRGNEVERRLRIQVLERPDGGDWSLTIFDEPADVKGVALLTYSNGLDPDDQWLYMPALKRVKRIASKKKSGAFMGSEFSFEDFSSNDIRKFTYKFLMDETLDGEKCTVTEWIPLYKYSGYKRMLVWIDSLYRIQKIDFYNHQDKLIKTLLNQNYQLFLDKYWRPMQLDMYNHLDKKRTILVYESYKFRLGLTQRDFDKNALKRAR